jgi:hypothetical protein
MFMVAPIIESPPKATAPLLQMPNVFATHTEVIQTNDTLYEIGPAVPLSSVEIIKQLFGSKVLVKAVDTDGSIMCKTNDAEEDQLRWKEMPPHDVESEIRQRRIDHRNKWQGRIAPLAGELVVASEYALVLKPCSPNLPPQIILTDDLLTGVQMVHQILSELPLGT